MRQQCRGVASQTTVCKNETPEAPRLDGERYPSGVMGRHLRRAPNMGPCDPSPSRNVGLFRMAYHVAAPRAGVERGTRQTRAAGSRQGDGSDPRHHVRIQGAHPHHARDSCRFSFCHRSPSESMTDCSSVRAVVDASFNLAAFDKSRACPDSKSTIQSATS